MSAAFFADLGSIWKPLPMIVLGCPSIISGFLVLNLPETSGQPLPDGVFSHEEILNTNNSKTVVPKGHIVTVYPEELVKCST